MATVWNGWNINMLADTAMHQYRTNREQGKPAQLGKIIFRLVRSKHLASWDARELRSQIARELASRRKTNQRGSR